MASRWSRFIFQLPLTSGRRRAPGPVTAARTGRGRPRASGAFGRGPEGGQTGQVAVLEQFERGPAAGGDEADPVGQAQRVHRGRAVAPPTTVKPGHCGHGLGHARGPGAEPAVLEDTHGPVPQHGPG